MRVGANTKEVVKAVSNDISALVESIDKKYPHINVQLATEHFEHDDCLKVFHDVLGGVRNEYIIEKTRIKIV